MKMGNEPPIHFQRRGRASKGENVSLFLIWSYKSEQLKTNAIMKKMAENIEFKVMTYFDIDRLKNEDNNTKFRCSQAG